MKCYREKRWHTNFVRFQGFWVGKFRSNRKWFFEICSWMQTLMSRKGESFWKIWVVLSYNVIYKNTRKNNLIKWQYNLRIFTEFFSGEIIMRMYQNVANMDLRMSVKEHTSIWLKARTFLVFAIFAFLSEFLC